MNNLKNILSQNLDVPTNNQVREKTMKAISFRSFMKAVFGIVATLVMVLGMATYTAMTPRVAEAQSLSPEYQTAPNHIVRGTTTYVYNDNMYIDLNMDGSGALQRIEIPYSTPKYNWTISSWSIYANNNTPLNSYVKSVAYDETKIVIEFYSSLDGSGNVKFDDNTTFNIKLTWDGDIELYEFGYNSPSGVQLTTYNFPGVPIVYTTTPEASNSNSLKCEPGNFYSITATGKVYNVAAPVNGSGFSGANTTSIDFSAVRNISGDQMNGLGIGYGGNVAYAFDRNVSTGGSKGVSIYRWDSTTNKAARVSTYVPKEGELPAKDFIGGAVDPTNSNLFYFGGSQTVYVGTKNTWVRGYYDSNGYWHPGRWVAADYFETRFKVFKYDHTLGAVSYLGYVVADLTTNQPSRRNGDLAFSSTGDMFILYHDGVTNVRLVPVAAESLSAASQNPGQKIPSQDVTSIKVNNPDGAEFNGLAFNHDGNVIVENSASGIKPTMRMLDPSTGDVSRAAQQLQSTWTYGTDLASCNGFPTIELKKNVISRVKPSDQFGLEISRVSDTPGAAGTVVASATTNGTTTGIQSEYVGPVPAVVGKRYIVKETGSTAEGDTTSAPADLKRYNTSLVCTNTSTGSAVPLDRISDTEWSFVVPQATNYKVPVVSCMYTNGAKVGDLKWAKTDGAGKPLAGSEWTIVGPSPTTTRKVVTDNVGQEGYSGLDVDPAPGKFLVEGLEFGNYTLAESKAPDGYAITNTAPKNFELSNKILVKDFGKIENYPIQLQWTKIDSKTKSILPNSTWKLSKDGKDTVVADCVSDASGCAGPDRNGTGGQFVVKDIKPGIYTLVEHAAPDGYIKSDVVTKIEITNTGYKLNGSAEQKFTIDSGTKTASILLGEYPNTPAVADVKFTKLGPDKKLLGGSTWSVTMVDGSGADAGPKLEIVDCVSAPCAQDSLDQDPAAGQFHVKDLALGKYKLEETKAPDGYGIPEGGLSRTFELTVNHIDIAFDAGSFVNELAKGNVSWSKVAGGHPLDQEILLSGSKWEVTPVTGNNGTPTGSPMKIDDCTKADCSGLLDKDPTAGRFRVEGLNAGWYMLVEKQAPERFILDDSPHYFQILRDEETVEVGPVINLFDGTETLPRTGGNGIGLPLGVAMALIAAGFLYSRRRA